MFDPLEQEERHVDKLIDAIAQDDVWARWMEANSAAKDGCISRAKDGCIS